MNRSEVFGTGNKNILVLTGVHGNEISPVYAGYLLKKFDFDKSKFKKLTILNAVNTDGIKNNIREIPDNKTSDLNRMFKVDLDNNISVDELTKLFNDNDVIIDVHSSPSCCEFILLNQDETTNSYVEFALKMILNILFVIPIQTQLKNMV